MDFNQDDNQRWQEPIPPQPQVVLREVTQQKDNKFATTAMVLGIITLLVCWVPVLAIITGIVGIIISIVSLIKEDRKWMPILGMIFSIIGLTIAAIFTLGFLVEFLYYMNNPY